MAEDKQPSLDPAFILEVNDRIWLHNGTYCCCGGRIDSKLLLGPLRLQSGLLERLRRWWHRRRCVAIVISAEQFDCPICGPRVLTDEDGRCSVCGESCQTSPNLEVSVKHAHHIKIIEANSNFAGHIQ